MPETWLECASNIMKKCCSEIYFSRGGNTLNFFDSKLDSDKKKDVIDFLNGLYYCDCCDRHQLNKPVLFKKWIDNDRQNNEYDYTCTCDCRHTARMVCRAIDEE